MSLGREGTRRARQTPPVSAMRDYSPVPSMLDPRTFRASLLPVLLVLIVVAFSLENRPGPLRSAFAPDAFDGARASQLLDGLNRAHPFRRAGSTGDTALGRTVAGLLDRALLGRVDVRTRVISGETLDGDSELLTVTAQEPGSSPRPQIVLVAQRDSARARTRADLSGTAALIEIARAIGASRPARTITFASISGASGGQAGMHELVASLRGPVQAVIEIGDLAGDPGEPGEHPPVVGWSADPGSASVRLQRTVALAVRREAGVTPGYPRARTQLARYALPQGVSGQSIALAAGIPAVRLSLGGELPSAPGTPVSADRLETFGRAALRVLDALDGELAAGEPTRDLAVAKKILPEWAMRLLVAALLLPATLMVGDGAARLWRRGEPLGGAVAWVAGLTLPFAAAALLARALALTGAIPDLDPAPPPGAVPLDGAAWTAMGCCAALLALVAVLLRPRLGRRLASARGAAPLALLLVTCVLAWVSWAGNPYAALLLVLPANLWLLLAEGARPRRALAAALVLASLAPVGLVIAAYADALAMGPGEVPWYWMLAVAGGAVSVPAALLWSVGAGAAVAALLLALRGAPADGERPVTVRGPLSYAGPGSLGGTDSAVRR
jgi:hypothetical protein